MTNRRFALIAALGLAAAWAPSAWSQAWPAKPITFIVPNPRQGTDNLAHQHAQKNEHQVSGLQRNQEALHQVFNHQASFR